MSDTGVIVPEALDGERADKALAVLLACSRGVARAIIDAEDATIEGVPVQASQKVAAGSIILASIPEIDDEIRPDDTVEFEVLFDDSDVLVIDKPAGVVVHPSSGPGSGTLVNGLIARYPEIVGVGQEGRWGIVHRLDKDTSGLMVVARSHRAYERLIEMMKDRQVSRRYLAVVKGLFTNTTGTIDAPLGRDPQNPTRIRLVHSGKPSRTHYRRLVGWESHDASLLSVALETGRTHQIRVHMQSIDHPVLGDRTYGRHGVIGDPGRQWLHARQLTFDHPITDTAIDTTSRLPADLDESLTSLTDGAAQSIVDEDGALL